MRSIINPIQIAVAILIMGQSTQAASGWDEHATHLLYFQTLNVVILVGAIIYFLRGSVKEFFKSRAESYHAEALKAQAALKEAQAQLSELQANLTKVETTWAESLSRAQAEAVELKNRLNKQTQDLNLRLIEEAKKSLQIETNARNQKLVADLIQTSTALVEHRLKTQLSEEDHKRLQKSFNKSVESSAI